MKHDGQSSVQHAEQQVSETWKHGSNQPQLCEDCPRMQILYKERQQGYDSPFLQEARIELGSSVRGMVLQEECKNR